jgi:SAM-dependent methyltransferase
MMRARLWLRMMDRSLLVKLFGFPATLVHGEAGVLDRWLWLKDRLPLDREGSTLLDIGCGTGAFTIGAALRGYRALGLSWDERNQAVAAERAAICGADQAKFEVQDVRMLDQRRDLIDSFDVLLCCENIEHISDDAKLMRDMAACLKPGGRLHLTAPYYYYKSITDGDNGPFDHAETGWHVRRGYTTGMLRELCEHAGLIMEETTDCVGFLSQKITAVQRRLGNVNPMVGWAATLPWRLAPPLLDPVLSHALKWPPYSICMSAYKPRYASNA